MCQLYCLFWPCSIDAGAFIQQATSYTTSWSSIWSDLTRPLCRFFSISDHTLEHSDSQILSYLCQYWHKSLALCGITWLCIPGYYRAPITDTSRKVTGLTWFASNTSYVSVPRHKSIMLEEDVGGIWDPETGRFLTYGYMRERERESIEKTGWSVKRIQTIYPMLLIFKLPCNKVSTIV